MEEAVEKEKDKKDGESESESKESTPETEEVDEDDASREISLYCKEWRADAVRPQWLFFQQHKTDTSGFCSVSACPQADLMLSIWLCPPHRAHPSLQEAFLRTSYIRE